MTKEARFRLFVYQARALAAEYRAAIINWTSLNEGRVLDYKSYFWRVPYEQAVKKRNDLEAAIKISRMNNDGDVDFTTLDEIWHWGFSEEQNFPMRDQDRILRVTPEALAYLDSGDCFNACKTLMPITYHYPHPSGATKILGLSDQENYCIYDSRVGRALDSLRKDGKKIVLCPSSEDMVQGSLLNGWAEQYQRLIWTVKIMQDYLRPKQKDRTVSQIEMALFMLGKPSNP